MNKYIFSPHENMFYPIELRALYRVWPKDSIDVTDSVFDEFTGAPPDGKMRGVDNSGMPCWVDIPGVSRVTAVGQQAS